MSSSKKRLTDVDLRCLIESVRVASGKSPALPFSDVVLDCLRELQDRRAEVLRLNNHIVDVYNAQEAKQGETKARRAYHANGTYWSGVPTVDMPCDFCARPIVDHDPRTHACPETSGDVKIGFDCYRCADKKMVVHNRITGHLVPCPECNSEKSSEQSSASAVSPSLASQESASSTGSTAGAGPMSIAKGEPQC